MQRPTVLCFPYLSSSEVLLTPAHGAQVTGGLFHMHQRRRHRIGHPEFDRIKPKAKSADERSAYEQVTAKPDVVSHSQAQTSQEPMILFGKSMGAAGVHLACFEERRSILAKFKFQPRDPQRQQQNHEVGDFADTSDLLIDEQMRALDHTGTTTTTTTLAPGEKSFVDCEDGMDLESLCRTAPKFVYKFDKEKLGKFNLTDQEWRFLVNASTDYNSVRDNKVRARNPASMEFVFEIPLEWDSEKRLQQDERSLVQMMQNLHRQRDTMLRTMRCRRWLVNLLPDLRLLSEVVEMRDNLLLGKLKCVRCQRWHQCCLATQLEWQLHGAVTGENSGFHCSHNPYFNDKDCRRLSAAQCRKESDNDFTAVTRTEKEGKDFLRCLVGDAWETDQRWVRFKQTERADTTSSSAGLLPPIGSALWTELVSVGTVSDTRVAKMDLATCVWKLFQTLSTDQSPVGAHPLPLKRKRKRKVNGSSSAEPARKSLWCHFVEVLEKDGLDGLVKDPHFKSLRSKDTCDNRDDTNDTTATKKKPEPSIKRRKIGELEMGTPNDLPSLESLHLKNQDKLGAIAARRLRYSQRVTRPRQCDQKQQAQDALDEARLTRENVIINEKIKKIKESRDTTTNEQLPLTTTQSRLDKDANATGETDNYREEEEEKEKEAAVIDNVWLTCVVRFCQMLQRLHVAGFNLSRLRVSEYPVLDQIDESVTLIERYVSNGEVVHPTLWYQIVLATLREVHGYTNSEFSPRPELGLSLKDHMDRVVSDLSRHCGLVYKGCQARSPLSEIREASAMTPWPLARRLRFNRILYKRHQTHAKSNQAQSRSDRQSVEIVARTSYNYSSVDWRWDMRHLLRTCYTGITTFCQGEDGNKLRFDSYPHRHFAHAELWYMDSPADCSERIALSEFNKYQDACELLRVIRPSSDRFAGDPRWFSQLETAAQEEMSLYNLSQAKQLSNSIETATSVSAAAPRRSSKSTVRDTVIPMTQATGSFAVVQPAGRSSPQLTKQDGATTESSSSTATNTCVPTSMSLTNGKPTSKNGRTNRSTKKGDKDIDGHSSFLDKGISSWQYWTDVETGESVLNLAQMGGFSNVTKMVRSADHRDWCASQCHFECTRTCFEQRKYAGVPCTHQQRRILNHTVRHLKQVVPEPAQLQTLMRWICTVLARNIKNRFGRFLRCSLDDFERVFLTAMPPDWQPPSTITTFLERHEYMSFLNLINACGTVPEVRRMVDSLTRLYTMDANERALSTHTAPARLVSEAEKRVYVDEVFSVSVREKKRKRETETVSRQDTLLLPPVSASVEEILHKDAHEAIQVLIKKRPHQLRADSLKSSTKNRQIGGDANLVWFILPPGDRRADDLENPHRWLLHLHEDALADERGFTMWKPMETMNLSDWHELVKTKLSHGFRCISPSSECLNDALFDFRDTDKDHDTLPVEDIAPLRLKLNVLKWLARWVDADNNPASTIMHLMEDKTDFHLSEPVCELQETYWVNLNEPAGPLLKWRLPSAVFSKTFQDIFASRVNANVTQTPNQESISLV